MILVSNGRISKKQGRMDRWEEGRKEGIPDQRHYLDKPGWTYLTDRTKGC